MTNITYMSMGHSDISKRTVVSLKDEQYPIKHCIKTETSRPPLLCSCRFTLSIISCLAFVTLYSQRVNLSVVMVCMVNHSAVTEMTRQKYNGTLPDTLLRSCTDLEDNITARSGRDKEHQDGEFAWSKEVQGLLLGSFFLGTLTSPLLAGWLSEKFGGKHVLGWSMLASAIVTICMPIAARSDYKALFALRVLDGVFQGVLWPAMSVIWSRWAPPLERQFLNGLSYSGGSMGTVVTFPVADFLCDYGFDGGWPSVFYCQGLAGIVVFLAWSFLVYDLPEEHPWISDVEKEYICSSLKENILMPVKKGLPTPWRQILMSTTVWAYIVATTCSNWGIYSFMTNIPSYMDENGLVSALPYIGLFLVTNISAAMFDAILSRQLCSLTLARKIGNTIGFLVPGLLVIGVGFKDCDSPNGAIALLVGSVSLCGFQFGAGYLTNPADFAPQYTGVISGLAKTISTLAGLIAPIMIGYITTDLQSQWQIVFFITSGFLIAGALIFIVFGSGELQEWACETMDVTFVSESSTAKSITSK